MTERERIAALPRRTPQEYRPRLHATTRRPGSSAALRESQGQALGELVDVGGLLGALRVGAGKTLVSMLAPVVLGSRRAVLLLPAALIEKTERERRTYAKDWLVATGLKLISYESLGRVAAARELEIIRPDLIVADEAHRLKNPRAACTRRVTRYMEAHPETRFVALTGTMVKDSLKNYAHLAAWCLKEKSPIPLDKDQVDAWASVVDEDMNFLKRGDPSVLDFLCEPGEKPSSAFRRRLTDTLGVVISGGDGCPASLRVSAAAYGVSDVTLANFRKLRKEWETPDGWALADAAAVWRHARELPLGLHYVWDPRPPQEWLDARRDWAKFVRGIITRSQRFDSELQVAQACQSGDLAGQGPELYAAWCEVRNTFRPNQKPIWHDTSALEACEGWIEHVGGVVWTAHEFFARELARRTGLRYFGGGGADASGMSIEECSDRSVIASIQANGTGRNLQRWSTALVTATPSGGDAWEQLLGRHHREGQTADEVEFYVMVGGAEAIKSMMRACQRAGMIEKQWGTPQKLISMCDYDFPDEPPAHASDEAPRWIAAVLGRDEDEDLSLEG